MFKFSTTLLHQNIQFPIRLRPISLYFKYIGKRNKRVHGSNWRTYYFRNPKYGGGARVKFTKMRYDQYRPKKFYDQLIKKDYKHYGARGITISEDWNVFTNFYRDMGDKPEGLSLDRINNDLGYSKDNCRWATRENTWFDISNDRRMKCRMCIK